MKISKIVGCVALCCALAAGPALADRGTVDWISGYITARGMGSERKDLAGSPAGFLMAKRAAIVDLQRNILETIEGVQVSSSTHVKNFEASEQVRSGVCGLVRGIEFTYADFSDGAFQIEGRVPIREVQKILAPAVCGKAPKKKKPAGSRGTLTGVVIDLRHLNPVPAATFRVLSPSGRVVYDITQVPQERYMTSGMCQYHDNIMYAKGLSMLGPNFVTVKALRMDRNSVDIVLSEKDSARLAGDHPFKRACAVAVVLKD